MPPVTRSMRRKAEREAAKCDKYAMGGRISRKSVPVSKKSKPMMNLRVNNAEDQKAYERFSKELKPEKLELLNTFFINRPDARDEFNAAVAHCALAPEKEHYCRWQTCDPFCDLRHKNET